MNALATTVLEAPRRRRLLRGLAGRIGAALVGMLVLFAVLGPLVSARDPNASDFEHAVGLEGTPIGPSPGFWLGADRIFRDEFTRLAVGARFSLFIGVSASAIALVVGGAVGLAAGYWEGANAVRLPRLGWRFPIDAILMRTVDALLAFPFLLFVMAIGAAVDRTTVASVLAILGLTGWLGTARIVRSKTMVLRNLDYVIAARALGQSDFKILVVHILPNLAGTLAVIGTLSVAQMIIAESILGFLGVGIAPPQPSWGHMILEGQDYYLAAPWLVVAPGVAILTAALGFNLLGEGMRDALEP